MEEGEEEGSGKQSRIFNKVKEEVEGRRRWTGGVKELEKPKNKNKEKKKWEGGSGCQEGEFF